MRAIALVTVVVAIATWGMLRHLPESTANLEAAVNRPVAHVEEVRSVALDGHRVLASHLRGVLTTRPGTQLRRELLDRDRSAMEQALAELGYLAARVQPAVVTFDAAGAAYVTFEIVQGPMFTLRSVEVTGPGKDAAVVTIGAGDDAVRDRIERARQGLVDVLTRRGPGATVELSVHTDLAAAAVDVVLATRAAPPPVKRHTRTSRAR